MFGILMEPQKEKLIKNKSSILSGLLLGITTIYFFTELFQGFVAYLFGAENLIYSMKGFFFSADFILPGELNSLSYIFILTSNVIFIIVLIEFTMLGLKKTGLGFYRYSLILFQLVMVGYLIVNIFYGAFSIFINVDLNNNWLLLSEYLGINGPSKIAYMFFVVLILLAYLNMVSRRIQKYINI